MVIYVQPWNHGFFESYDSLMFYVERLFQEKTHVCCSDIVLFNAMRLYCKTHSVTADVVYPCNTTITILENGKFDRQPPESFLDHHIKIISQLAKK